MTTVERQEVKSGKFIDLAEARTAKALEAIGKIGNLAKKSLYHWEPDEVAMIVSALNDAVSDVEQRFNGVKVTGSFSLSQRAAETVDDPTLDDQNASSDNDDDNDGASD